MISESFCELFKTHQLILANEFSAKKSFRMQSMTLHKYYFCTPLRSLIIPALIRTWQNVEFLRLMASESVSMCFHSYSYSVLVFYLKACLKRKCSETLGMNAKKLNADCNICLQILLNRHAKNCLNFITSYLHVFVYLCLPACLVVLEHILAS